MFKPKSSNKKYFLIIILVITFGFVLPPQSTYAVDPPTVDRTAVPGSADRTATSPTVGAERTPQAVFTLKNPLKVDSVAGLIQSFVVVFSYIVILFAVLAIIWVGFQFILARGNPERMNELKSWLLWIVVGVAIVIGARLIIQVVISTLSASGAIDKGTLQSVQKAAGGQ